MIPRGGGRRWKQLTFNNNYYKIYTTVPEHVKFLYLGGG